MMKINTLVVTCLMMLPLSANAVFITNKVKVESPSSVQEFNLFAIDIQLAQLGINEQLSPLVGDLFNEVNQAKIALQNDIRTTLLAVPEIERVTYSLVDTYPLQLNLSQSNNSFFANLNGLGASVGGKADAGIPIFCTNVNFGVSIQNIDVTLQYNLSSGVLSLSSIDYDLSTNASCSGLLGFLGTLFVEPAFEDAIEGAVDDAVRDIEGTLAMQQLFSIRDLSNEIVSLPIGGASPQIQASLFKIRDLLDGININTNISVGAELSQEIVNQYEGPFVLTFTTNILTLRSNL